jgi:hypothetical protein
MEISKARRLMASLRRRLADRQAMVVRWWRALDLSIAAAARAESLMSLPLSRTHRSAAGQTGDRIGRFPRTLA